MRPLLWFACLSVSCASLHVQAAEPGQLAFNNRCRTCHSVKEGDNRQGPSLHAIVGRQAGSSPGYSAYSQALTNSKMVWDEKSLDAFIANPDAVVPGHNMRPYAGLPDAKERQEIVAYLKSVSSASE